LTLSFLIVAANGDILHAHVVRANDSSRAALLALFARYPVNRLDISGYQYKYMYDVDIVELRLDQTSLSLCFFVTNAIRND
jgi:hypothetical protein